mmetsp:Transcript_4092/g.9780  ORF Transcript_4092/g.9780 Transcript_4092/m.9780 type:complete len:308 (-) Transcript_4092:525-1448(-)
MATGVSSGLPSKTSPIAKMWSADVCSCPPTPPPVDAILPEPPGARSTPALSSPSASVTAYRPMARMTVSNASSFSFPSPFLKVAFTPFPPGPGAKDTGTHPRMKRVPVFSMCSTTLFEHSLSKPRSGIDRIMTAASCPSPEMNPAHSRATYDAPTTSVLPGASLREKRSSLVMQCSSSPGTPGYLGRPPTAMTNAAAVYFFFRPLASVPSIVCGSMNEALALRYVTSAPRSWVVYPKLSEQMWFCTLSTMAFQSCSCFSPTFHPNAAASPRYSPRCAARCISFFGMHPTLTHVPPRPHRVPLGVGST